MNLRITKKRTKTTSNTMELTIRIFFLMDSTVSSLYVPESIMSTFKSIIYVFQEVRNQWEVGKISVEMGPISDVY
jgi:hypothetical protein